MYELRGREPLLETKVYSRTLWQNRRSTKIATPQHAGMKYTPNYGSFITNRFLCILELLR